MRLNHGAGLEDWLPHLNDFGRVSAIKTLPLRKLKGRNYALGSYFWSSHAREQPLRALSTGVEGDAEAAQAEYSVARHHQRSSRSLQGHHSYGRIWRINRRKGTIARAPRSLTRGCFTSLVFPSK